MSICAKITRPVSDDCRDWHTTQNIYHRAVKFRLVQPSIMITSIPLPRLPDSTVKINANKLCTIFDPHIKVKAGAVKPTD
jgi:hypothetical protein